jgi:hypothetical protein
MFFPDPNFYLSRMPNPDPGVKKHWNPDPQHCAKSKLGGSKLLEIPRQNLGKIKVKGQ